MPVVTAGLQIFWRGLLALLLSAALAGGSAVAAPSDLAAAHTIRIAGVLVQLCDTLADPQAGPHGADQPGRSSAHAACCTLCTVAGLATPPDRASPAVEQTSHRVRQAQQRRQGVVLSAGRSPRQAQGPPAV